MVALIPSLKRQSKGLPRAGKSSSGSQRPQDSVKGPASIHEVNSEGSRPWTALNLHMCVCMHACAHICKHVCPPTWERDYKHAQPPHRNAHTKRAQSVFYWLLKSRRESLGLGRWNFPMTTGSLTKGELGQVLEMEQSYLVQCRYGWITEIMQVAGGSRKQTS